MDVQLSWTQFGRSAKAYVLGQARRCCVGRRKAQWLSSVFCSIIVVVVVMKRIGTLDLLPPEQDKGANTFSFRGNYSLENPN